MEKGKINNDYLNKFAVDNNFLYLGLLNAQGNAVYQSGNLQTNMLDAKELVKKWPEINHS